MIRVHEAKNPEEHPFNILLHAVIPYTNSVNKTHGFAPYELVFGHTSSRHRKRSKNHQQLISNYILILDNCISYYTIARERTEQQMQKAKHR